MKNTKLILALVAPLILSGCNGSSKKVSFKDNLEYERLLTTSEAAIVGSRVGKKLLEEGKKITASGNMSQQAGNMKATATVSMEAQLFDDYYAYQKEEGTMTLTENGVTTTTKHSQLEEFFIDSSKLSLVTVTTEQDGEDKEYEIDVESYLPEDADFVKESFNTLALSNVDIFGEGEVFAVKGGGYAMVASVINEVREDVPFGSAVREYVTIEKEQMVTLVDKNYKVTSVSMVMQQITNRDPITNEWFNKEKTIAETSYTGSVTYGKRASAGKKLTQALENASKETLDSFNLEVAYGIYNAETTLFTVKGVASLNSSNYKAVRTDIDRYHVETAFRIPDYPEANAFGVGATCVRREHYAADSLNVNKMIPLEGFQTRIDSLDHTLMLLPEEGIGINVILSFDAVAAHGGVSIENLEQHVY